MTSFKDAMRRMGWAGLIALQLAGCASAPPRFAPSRQALPPSAPIVTMTPIPNPQEGAAHERRNLSHSHSAAPAPKRERPAAPPPPAAAAAPAKPSANPARAAQLRARGLEELNRGAVEHAVALLTQASELDPANPVIRRDLDRAERIARAVHAPR